MSEPAPPSAPLATGGMSRGGATQTVPLHQPAVDATDKKVLCSAICQCKDAPGVGQDGRSLKQSCVSNQLRELDKALAHRSPYKAEVNYDMTKRPPEPVMDSSIPTKAHDWLPGWISKYWEQDHGLPYLKGMGMVRRPDAIIVIDPTKPPVQDNIKQVVEIKFPPDTMSDPQKIAYIRIAGDESKLVTLGPQHCDCDKPEPEHSKIPIRELGMATTALKVIYMLVTRRPAPGGSAAPTY